MRFFQDLFKRLHYRRFQERDDRRRRLMGQVLALIAMLMGLYYLIWHYFYINWQIWYISVPFFFAEISGWLLITFFAMISWYRRYHDPEGIESDRLYSVDVIITTCGEPIEILRETLEAVAAIDYPKKKVYVLDDAASPQVETLTRDCGFHYLSRPEPTDAKAGNLNYGLQHSNSELILTLDADQVPQPQIIKRLVGYFKIPRIGFVQSKQNFRVPPGDPFGNTDKIFYNIMQSGKDDANAVFSCGSGVLYRRKALEEIGGFSTWNLVEDLYTSMILHQRGWISIYYNYPLSIGSAPTDIWSVYRQRCQWAVDSLRIFFWDNPLFQRGLTRRQKLQYFHIGFVYLVAGWIMPLFFIIPIWSIFTSSSILTAPVPLYIANRLPYFLVTAISYAILTSPTPYLQSFQLWSGLFPVFIQATITALGHPRSKPRYRVNSKEHLKGLRRPAVFALLPQLIIIIGCLLAIVYGLFFNGTAPLDFVMLNCAWATWAILILSGICMAGLSRLYWQEVPDSWFSPKQIIHNVLQMTIFVFLIILIAVMIMKLSK
jgi:cellulose synthase (UDP-forming)